MRLTIDIWSDIACPWCFIGKRRFERALAQFPHPDEVLVTWHSYQLDPTLPEHSELSERDYLVQAKGMAPEQVDQMLAQVTELAAAEGLSYDFEALIPANSRRAHQLIQATKLTGADMEVVQEALFSAHFEEGENTNDPAVLTRIGQAGGLKEDVLEELFTNPMFDVAVQEDIDAAGRFGIQAVPYFVIERQYGIPGAQPTEVFTQALTQVWEKLISPEEEAKSAQEADSEEQTGPAGETTS